jgi:hypothetical protein
LVLNDSGKLLDCKIIASCFNIFYVLKINWFCIFGRLELPLRNILNIDFFFRTMLPVGN